MFSRETQYPFRLFIPALRREVSLMDGNDKAADHPVRDTLLIVQTVDSEDEYLDDFLNLLLEVCIL